MKNDFGYEYFFSPRVFGVFADKAPQGSDLQLYPRGRRSSQASRMSGTVSCADAVIHHLSNSIPKIISRDFLNPAGTLPLPPMGGCGESGQGIQQQQSFRSYHFLALFTFTHPSSPRLSKLQYAHFLLILSIPGGFKKPSIRIGHRLSSGTVYATIKCANKPWQELRAWLQCD